MIKKISEEKRKWEAETEQNLREARKRWEVEQRPSTSNSSESLLKLLKKKDEELSVLRQEFQGFLQKYSESSAVEAAISIKEPAISTEEPAISTEEPVSSPPQSEPEPVEVEESGWISSFLGSIFLTDRQRGIKS